MLENETTVVETSPVTETYSEDNTIKTISVQNPTAAEMQALCDNIKVNYDFNVITKPTKFNFKKTKDKDTGLETVRESVELAIPYPSVDGIIAILEGGGKGLELMVDAMESVINAAARELLSEDISLTAATFPVEKLSWEHIAHIPKATRRGGGIPKETWEEFAQDYCAVMPVVTGKTIEQVTNAAKILQGKLAQVKTNEPVLQLLVEQLAIYAENSPAIEEYQDCVAFLLGRADTFLNVSAEELLANL